VRATVAGCLLRLRRSGCCQLQSPPNVSTSFPHVAAPSLQSATPSPSRLNGHGIAHQRHNHPASASLGCYLPHSGQLFAYNSCNASLCPLAVCRARISVHDRDKVRPFSALTERRGMGRGCAAFPCATASLSGLSTGGISDSAASTSPRAEEVQCQCVTTDGA
jgi:hypothetical protein